MRHAFSLVELSIVLVILGLLTGGILAGQSLIRASELRAVTNEYQRYATAAKAFRDKYFQLPGDMNNATSFWGKDSTYCNGHSGTAATDGTCNGDANSILSLAAVAGGTGEYFQFWKHLALAQLIEGTYTGTAPAAHTARTIPGTNGPKSRLGTAGWSVYNLPNYAGDGEMYAADFGNALVFGATSPNGATDSAALKPEEAWNIDTKMDDGRPGTGKILVRYWNNSCATGGASASDTTNSTYRLTNTAVACSFWFRKEF